jgi:protocatechuate 3,4-dioxygenase beta subunit
MHHALIAVLLLAAMRPMAAQNPPAAPQPSREAPPARDNAGKGTGVIRGRIFDAASGRPLPRAEVRAGPNAPQFPENRIVMTDGDGRYELRGLPAEAYVINVFKTNYVRASWGAERPEGPGKRIQLGEGQVLEKIDVRIVRAGAITGRVIDEFGEPVTDVQVTPMRYQYQQGTRRLTPSGRAGYTNDIGEYRIFGLTPGQYYVNATLRNFSNGMDTASTDRSGYAATYYPGTGNVAEAQRMTIAAGQTIAGINLALLPIQTARVSGIALDAQGRPLAGATVFAMQRVGFAGFGGMPGQVRPDGKFTLSGLTPGVWVVNVNVQGSQETASMTISIDGSDVNDLQLVAVKPSTIRGRVVFQDGGTPPKASSIRVTALRQDPMFGGGGNSTVKDDLTFEMKIVAGHVFVRSPPTGPNWRLNRVLLNGEDITDTGLEVPRDGSISDVVVELTDRLYPVSGRVSDGNGALVRDCFVIVFGQDPAGWTPGTRYLASVRPGLDDLYHAKMPAGDYYAVAIADVDQGAWTDPEFLSQVRDRATKFTIVAGETTSVDLPLSAPPVF